MVGAVISLGLVSSISAMTWIGPRVTMTMGEDMPLLRLFSRKSKRDAPAFAIIFQLVVSNLLLLTQSFEAVLDFIQFSLTFCSFFTVLGAHQNAHYPPASGAAVPRLGLPCDTDYFPRRDAVHDVLSCGQPAAAIACRLRHDVGRVVIYYASRLSSNVAPSDVSQPVA